MHTECLYYKILINFLTFISFYFIEILSNAQAVLNGDWHINVTAVLFIVIKKYKHLNMK